MFALHSETSSSADVGNLHNQITLKLEQCLIERKVVYSCPTVGIKQNEPEFLKSKMCMRFQFICFMFITYTRSDRFLHE